MLRSFYNIQSVAVIPHNVLDLSKKCFCKRVQRNASCDLNYFCVDETIYFKVNFISKIELYNFKYINRL